MEIRNLSLRYGARELLAGASASFRRGEFTALIGRNGTGKSTLLRAMAGLGATGGGSIEIGGRSISSYTAAELASTVAFVSTERIRIANLRVRDAVALGRTPYTDWLGRLSAEDNARIDEAVGLVGIGPLADKSMDRLSDGERQRVMIARALAQDTPVILLDEPTAFLDLPGKYETSVLLRRLAREHGRCIICSTHDLSVALQTCDNVSLLDGGRLVTLPVGDMAGSGLLNALFCDSGLKFDPCSRSILFADDCGGGVKV